MAVELLRLARQLAGHNKMQIGDVISRVLPSGTKVSVINKGKGIFEKVIKKVDGSEIHSRFRKAECLRVDGKNARGTWSIFPQTAKAVDWQDGINDPADEVKKYIFSTNIKGLRRPAASYTKTLGEKGFAEFQFNNECGWGNLPGPTAMIERGPDWADVTHDYLIKNIKTCTKRVLNYLGRY